MRGGHTAPKIDGFLTVAEVAEQAHTSVQLIRMTAKRLGWQVCGIEGRNFAFFAADDPAILSYIAMRQAKVARGGRPTEPPPTPPRRNIVPLPPPRKTAAPTAPRHAPRAPVDPVVARIEERVLGNAHALAKELYPAQYRQRFARGQRS